MKKTASWSCPPSLLLAASLVLALGRQTALGGNVLTTLYSFTGGNDGSMPAAGLVLGADGNFYGTTPEGGSEEEGDVFQINTNGLLTPIYGFNGYPDGGLPEASLTLAADGSFYGTAYEGGADSWGVVFRVTTNGALTTLYSFTGGNDGANPFSPPAIGADGNLYGVASHGGPYIMSDPNHLGYGTVYQLATNGVLTTLYTFLGSSDDGGYPVGGLTFGSDGALYGTTSTLGASNAGTVFRITTAGKLTTIHSLNGGLDGGAPYAALTPAGSSGFYGTTTVGGAHAASDTNNFETGYGTVFQVSLNGAFSTIYSFAGGNDGSVPNAVVVGSDGTLYGTTQSGGTGSGVLFNLNQSGALTTLAVFGGTNGANPQGALALGGDGNWYGTTSTGGANGDGTVFVFGPGVSVTPAAPVFQSVATSGGLFEFSWSSVAGQMYQVEYKSDLTQSAWSNLTLVTAAGPTASATDSLANGARFYRVAVVP